MSSRLIRNLAQKAGVLLLDMIPKVALWSLHQHTCDTQIELRRKGGGRLVGKVERKERKEGGGEEGKKKEGKRENVTKKGEGEERRERGSSGGRKGGSKVEILVLLLRAEEMSSGKKCLKQELLTQRTLPCKDGRKRSLRRERRILRVSTGCISHPPFQLSRLSPSNPKFKSTQTCLTLKSQIAYYAARKIYPET